MLKMVDGTGIIGVDMICPLGVSTPQPPNYDNIEMEGVGSLVLANSLKAPLERVELLGNSVQGENPSPDNPQEIKSVGRKSNNLLIENISVFTVQDNIAYIPLPEGHETKLYTMLIQKKPGENDDVGFTCGFYDKSNMTATYSAPCLKDGNLVAENGIVNSKVGVNHFICFSPADSKFFDIYNVMYAEGKETTLDYEPYSDKYLLNVKVNGKNLFDREKARDINNWTDSIVQPGYIDFSIYVGKGNSVNISYSENLEAGLGFYAGIAQSVNNGPLYWLYHSLQQSLNKNNYKLIAECDYISVRVIKSNLQGFLEHIKTLQIENSNTPTSYEPYTEQSVQIALNEPLRGIGDYKDTITKDGVVRKIHEQTLKKEQISMNEYNWDTKYFRLYVNPDKKIDSSINIHELFSNMFKKFVIYKGNPNVYWIISEEEIRSMGITEADSLQVAYEKIKDFVTTNDIVIQYPIVETTLEPLPESVQAQLQALHSYNGTTHITVDSGEVPCGIKLTYRKEK